MICSWAGHYHGRPPRLQQVSQIRRHQRLLTAVQSKPARARFPPNSVVFDALKGQSYERQRIDRAMTSRVRPGVPFASRCFERIVRFFALASLVVHDQGMMKSSDLRGRQAVVRQHEVQQQASFFKNEILPRGGIVGFLAGWSLMSVVNRILKNDSSKQ